MKTTDDGSVLVNARIVTYGNEDRSKDKLPSDCSMCSPVGVRILPSIYVLHGWLIVNIDLEGALLQTGPAEIYVYMITPRESKHRDELRLLLAAEYGLTNANANAKWNVQSDKLMEDLGFVKIKFIPQLFVKFDNGQLSLNAARVVDDIMITGGETIVENFVKRFNSKNKLGMIVRGPGPLCFYLCDVIQHEMFTITVSGDE